MLIDKKFLFVFKIFCIHKCAKYNNNYRNIFLLVSLMQAFNFYVIIITYKMCSFSSSLTKFNLPQALKED